MKTESLCKPKAESLLYAEAPPNFMEQSDIKLKKQARFISPKRPKKTNSIAVLTQYKVHVLRIQSPCTASATVMYCKYKTFVLTQRKRSYTTDSPLFVFHSTGMRSFAIKVKLPPLLNKLRCARYDVDLYKFTFPFRQKMKKKVSDNHYEDKNSRLAPAVIPDSLLRRQGSGLYSSTVSRNGRRHIADGCDDGRRQWLRRCSR